MSFRPRNALAALILLVFVGGCGSSKTKLYEGPDLPRENLAHIILDNEGWLPDPSNREIWIKDPDDMQFSFAIHKGPYDPAATPGTPLYSGPALKAPLKILPGTYTVNVGLGLIDTWRTPFVHMVGSWTPGILVSTREDYWKAHCFVEFTATAGQAVCVSGHARFLGRVRARDLDDAGSGGLVALRRLASKTETTYRTEINYDFMRVAFDIAVRDSATLAKLAYATFDPVGKAHTLDREALVEDWSDVQYAMYARERDGELATLKTYGAWLRDVQRVGHDGVAEAYDIGMDDSGARLLEPGRYTLGFVIDLDLSSKRLDESLDHSEVKHLTFQAESGKNYHLLTWDDGPGAIKNWGGGIAEVYGHRVVAGTTQDQYLFEKHYGSVTNVEDPETLETLIDAMGYHALDIGDEADKQARIYAIGRVVESGDDRIVDRLIEMVSPRPLGTLTLAAGANALGRIGDPRAVEPLAGLLVHLQERFEKKSSVTLWEPWKAVLQALGRIGDARAVEPILDILKYFEVEQTYTAHIIKEEAALALGRIGDPRAAEPLLGVLSNYRNRVNVRGAAALALGQIGDERATEPIILGLERAPRDEFFRNFIRALGLVGGPRSVEALVNAYPGVPFRDKLAIIEALGQIGSTEEIAVDRLVEFLGNLNTPVRIAAVRSLEGTGSPRAIEPLIQRLRYDDLEVKMASLYALRKITRENVSPEPEAWETWWSQNRQRLEQGSS